MLTRSPSTTNGVLLGTMISACVTVPTALSAATLPQQTALDPGAPTGTVEEKSLPTAALPPLITDRPDFTESGVTVPTGMWQLEFGYTFTREPGVSTHEPGEALLRVGLSERIELRLGLGGFTRVNGPAGVVSGRSDTSIGAKIRLLSAGDGNSSRPDLALIVQTDLPSGSARLRQDKPAFGFTIAAGRNLGARASLGINAGYVRNTDDEDKRFDQATGSIALGYSISQRVGAYLEAFAFSATDSNGAAASFVNAGLTLLVSDELQIDTRAGHGLNGHSSDFFAGLGASVRW